MKKNSIKLKIYNMIFYMLLIVAIIVIGMIIYKYGSNQINEKESQEVVEAFSNIDFSENNEESEQRSQLDYKGYNVIGIVKIPKINIEYPIIEIGDIDPESAKKPMKLSIIKYWGENVNDYGNLSIAGHNNKDGTMFGKTKYLQIGDKIRLTNLRNETIEYEIFKIYSIEPDGVQCVESVQSGTREITLITCTNGHKNRLVTKARQVL